MGALATGFVGETRRIARSPLRLALLAAPFLAWAVCVAVYVQRLPRGLRAGVLDQDRTTLSRTLVRDLLAAPALEVASYGDLETLRADLRRGRIRAGIVIPRGTDEAVREGRTARVEMLRDATRSLPATQIWQAVSTVVATEAARQSAARLMRAGLPASGAKELALPLRLDGRPLGNPWMDYQRSFAPVLLPMFLQMALMIAGAACSGGSRRRSRAWSAGRILSWVVPVATAGGAIEFALAPSAGAGWALAGTTAALCLASGLVGLGFGRWMADPQKTVQMLLVFNTPAFLLSGFTFPEWAMPRLFEALTRPLPFSLWFDVAQVVQGETTGTLARGLAGLAAWLATGVLLLLPSARRGKASRSGPDLPAALSFLKIPGLATLVLLGPPGYFLLYGTVYADKQELRVPVAVVAGANAARTRDLVLSLSAHPRLDVRVESSARARSDLRAGEVRAVLEIPPDLDQRTAQGRSTSLALLVGADRFLVVGDLQRAVSEVLAEASTRLRAGLLAGGRNPSRARELANPLLLDDHPLGNPAETYGDAMLPVVGLLIAHQLLLVGAGTVASHRRSTGLRLAGGTGQILTLWGWFSLAAFAWLAWGLARFDVRTDARTTALLLCVPLGLLGAAALGAAGGWLVGRPVWWLRLAAFSSYPLFFLSGASWPLEATTGFARALAWFDPLGPLLDGSDRALRSGATLADVAPSLAHATVVALVWAGAAVLLHAGSRRRTARGSG